MKLNGAYIIKLHFKSILSVSEAICRLPKDVGSCKSNIDRWYFDTLKGECEIFSYSGCDGNLNNFNTLEQCQTLCAKYQKELWTTTELKKKVPEADISSVLTYNYQNDANAMSIITALTPNQQKRDDIIPKAKSNCEVSKWSNWSACNTTTAKCGIGFREKYRYILILWKAPQKGNGCIKFKATVVESVDTWFSEEGKLSRVLCEESPDSDDTQPKILKHCCTCDEAKYEVNFLKKTTFSH
nr:kunitz-type protease inhibitor 2-like [Leptinotarsa decemlineata]